MVHSLLTDYVRSLLASGTSIGSARYGQTDTKEGFFNPRSDWEEVLKYWLEDCWE